MGVDWCFSPFTIIVFPWAVSFGSCTTLFESGAVLRKHALPLEDILWQGVNFKTSASNSENHRIGKTYCILQIGISSLYFRNKFTAKCHDMNPGLELWDIPGGGAIGGLVLDQQYWKYIQNSRIDFTCSFMFFPIWHWQSSFHMALHLLSTPQLTSVSKALEASSCLMPIEFHWYLPNSVRGLPWHQLKGLQCNFSFSANLSEMLPHAFASSEIPFQARWNLHFDCNVRMLYMNPTHKNHNCIFPGWKTNGIGEKGFHCFRAKDLLLTS